MRTAEEMDLENAGEAIAAALRGRRFGSTEVLDARPRVHVDSTDELAVTIVLTLSPPPPPTKGDRTWPREDRQEIDSAYQEALRAVGLGGHSYLRLVASAPDVFARTDG
ncbi:MAG TPA: hypothetical protein VGO60_18465 [Iamia sp.]|jgi:hypothetical protein|nr:hypothetical protein [Iamia sp.]